ncbi:inositol-pentakisphosphate 2-kinase [Fennellomyces sp. T-0311]|nr:inositol-pentakisphosphate 2-kinase [Fennellomyces sp. T-0311]
MNPADWIYLAEGNQNIVLRYTGQDPFYVGQILRLQKESSLDARFQPVFARHVIGALLGDYIVPLTCVAVTPTFLKAIAQKIRHDRPDHRRARTIDLDQSWACLAPDLTYNKTITVEIKPKWGFKPQSPFIRPEFKLLKATTCRFCMHSWYKHSRSDLDYCPMDLYSMDPVRMKRALQALKSEPIHSKMSIHGNHPHVVDLITAILLREPLLPLLRNLQRDLDQLNIEGILPMYSKLNGSSLPAYDIDRWRSVVERFKTRDKSAVPGDADSQYVYEHVLSAVLKDCSIFISITPSHPRTIQLDDGSVWSYDIKLVDTDLKKISKIPYWHDLDQRIANHALQHPMARICQD